MKKLRDTDDDVMSTAVGDYIIYLKYIRNQVIYFI